VAVLVLPPSWVGWLITYGQKKSHINGTYSSMKSACKRVVRMAGDHDMI